MGDNWAKWDAEHGSGGGGATSAEKIAAQIRGSLGAGEITPPKTHETRGRSGSVVTRAEGSRSTASHVTKKDLKRPVQAKGEKNAGDSARTRINMAEYYRKKQAAVAGDPVDKHTPKTEIGVNPHQPSGLSARAVAATRAAQFSPSEDTHYAAAKAHLYAAGAALSLGKAQAAADHKHQAALHLQQASKEINTNSDLTPGHLKKLRDTAVAATTHALHNPSEKAHRDAAEAHAQASYTAKAMGKPIVAKDHLATAKHHSVQADQIAKNTKPGSSSARIAAAIKGVQSEHQVAHPAPVVHAPGSLEDRAQKAEAATALAQQHPTKENHLAAAQAHQAATTAGDAGQSKASVYHHDMASYHTAAANNPAGLIHAGVQVEHKDEQASRFPGGLHSMFAAFKDTISRRRSQKMYNAVPKASETLLAKTHKVSIKAYTGTHYSRINGHLRGTHPQTGPSKTAVENHITRLDAAFSKQPGIAHDLVTYRGTNSADKLFGDVGSKVGGEFQDLGYGSTSSHAAVTAGFGGNTGALIRIIHPQGSKLLKPSDAGSYGDAERELLVPRGTRYHVAADRVVTTHTGKSQRIIDLVRK